MMEMQNEIKEEEMDMEEDFGLLTSLFSFPMKKSTSSSLDHVGYAEYPMKYYRPISCSTGLLTNPHGSVKFLQGDTCVVAAVFGPSEVRISRELPHRGAVDVLFRPKVTGTSQFASPVMDPILGERNTESILISIFETSIHLEEIASLGYNIILHEFEDDGSLLSACINAITIALLDGGCSLRHAVAGVTLILTPGNKLIIDPSSAQLKQVYDVKFTYAFSNDLDIIYAHVQGHASPQALKIAQVTATQAASEMLGFFHFLTLKKNQKFLERGSKVSSEYPSAKVKEERVSPKKDADADGVPGSSDSNDEY